MDDTDKAILNRIQSDFPVTSRPYHSIANDLGLSGDDVLDRVARLKKNGIIRRIGGNFSPEKLGLVSTLCAAKVPEDKIGLFAQTVNKYPGVTHNYLRNHEYNIWFTFIAQDMATIEDSLRKISAETGATEIRNLPAVKTFKIKVDFEI